MLEDVVGLASIVVGLHPLDSPLRFSVSGGAQLEVCPSDYLGNTDPSASSWNPDIGFVACLSSSDGSSVEVPGQGRAAHRWVAMTVTPVVRGETTVRLAYTTADSFFQISSINADTAVNITFTPESSTIGVLRTDVNGGPSLGADGLVISPAGLSDAECDFPSEVSCVGPATPEKTASVTFVPRSEGDGVYLAWSSAPA